MAITACHIDWQRGTKIDGMSLKHANGFETNEPKTENMKYENTEKQKRNVNLLLILWVPLTVLPFQMTIFSVLFYHLLPLAKIMNCMTMITCVCNCIQFWKVHHVTWNSFFFLLLLQRIRQEKAINNKIVFPEMR